MSTSAERRAANDKQVADNVKQFGCHVYSVFDPNQIEPRFSYSIGIQETTGAPEAIVFGMSAELGHAMINEYLDQLRKGTSFEPGVLYSGFLEGFKILVEPAEVARLSEHTMGCARYYGDQSYSVVQLIYPTTSGVWPWEESASDWFRANQPMFGRVRPVDEA